MGGGLFALVVLLARFARRGPVSLGEALSLALMLVLLAPRGVWQEGFSWGAGFINYLLPMLGILLLSRLLTRQEPAPLAACGRPVLPLLPVFGDSQPFSWLRRGAWLVCSSAAVGSGSRPWPLWLGSWLGALVMFTASGYRNGTNADRRIDLSLILEHFRTIVAETPGVSGCRRPADQLPAGVAGIPAAGTVEAGGRGAGSPPPAAAVVCPGKLAGPAPVQLAGGGGRPGPGGGVVFPAGAEGGRAPLSGGRCCPSACLPARCCSSPPSGARNFLPTYVLLVLVAVLLYGEAREEGLGAVTRLAVPLSGIALAPSGGDLWQQLSGLPPAADLRPRTGGDWGGAADPSSAALLRLGDQ